MGGPDELPHLEVPPQVGIVESPADREHCQHNEQAGEGNRERKKPLESFAKTITCFYPAPNTGSGGSCFPQTLVEHLIGFSKSDEPMKVGPGDTKSACRESLVAIILADSVHGKFHFVFLYLAFE